MSFPRGEFVYLMAINKLAVHYRYLRPQQESWQPHREFFIFTSIIWRDMSILLFMDSNHLYGVTRSPFSAVIINITEPSLTGIFILAPDQNNLVFIYLDQTQWLLGPKCKHAHVCGCGYMHTSTRDRHTWTHMLKNHSHSRVTGWSSLKSFCHD